MIRFFFSISQAETNIGLYVCTRATVSIVRKKKKSQSYTITCDIKF